MIVLFTKEVFVQLKSITDIHVNMMHPVNMQGMPTEPQWQVFIQGMLEAGNAMNSFENQYSMCVSMPSREEAYRVFAELTQQLIDSGAVPELNNLLMDNTVLKET
jgi:H2-forming N5,N10-methylenetetrahydromethanopterin dehydrogenase-like enzyme